MAGGRWHIKCSYVCTICSPRTQMYIFESVEKDNVCGKYFRALKIGRCWKVFCDTGAGLAICCKLNEK